MTKVIWLGEDSEDEPGPSWMMWNGVKFRKDQPVEVTDAHMLAKARANRFYKVIEDKKPDQKEASMDDMVDVKRVLKPGRIYTEQEMRDEQTKAQEKELENKAQDLKEKVERKKYNYRQAEKGSGYSPQKPKAKKEKEAHPPADNADP
jgi:hypothetical protein